MADCSAGKTCIIDDGVIMTEPQTARELIDWFLDNINEHDPVCRKEVIEECEKDSVARKFFIDYAKEVWQRQQLIK